MNQSHTSNKPPFIMNVKGSIWKLAGVWSRGFPIGKNSFILLNGIADRVKYAAQNPLLKDGQCFISEGDAERLGLTKKELRTSKEYLEKNNLATFQSTPNGTIATILNSSIFDVLETDKNGGKNGKITGQTRGRPQGRHMAGLEAADMAGDMADQNNSEVSTEEADSSIDAADMAGDMADHEADQNAEQGRPCASDMADIVLRRRKDKNKKEEGLNSAGQAVASPKPKKKTVRETNPEAAEKRDELIALWCDLHEPQFGRAYAREFGTDEKAALALLGRTSQSPHEIMAVVTKAWALQANRQCWACQKAVTLKAVNAYWADIQAEIDRANSQVHEPAKPNGKPSLAKAKVNMAVALKIDTEKALLEVSAKLSQLADQLRYPQDREAHPEKVEAQKALKAEEQQLKARLEKLRLEMQAEHFGNETTETKETK